MKSTSNFCSCLVVYDLWHMNFSQVFNQFLINFILLTSGPAACRQQSGRSRDASRHASSTVTAACQQQSGRSRDASRHASSTVTAVSMPIASKSYHDPIVHGVKSKIRKKTAGKSSSCPEKARTGFQNPSEDRAILMGADQTI